MTRLLGRYAVSATLAGVVALAAGCTTDPQPAPPTTTSGVVSPTSPTSLPSPSTSASPTSVAYPTDLPAEALANTPEGAVAFARYFLKAMNRGYFMPAPGALSPLSTPACKSCAAYEAEFADLVSKHQHLDREPFVFTEVVVVPDTGPGAALSVDAVTQQQAVKIVDSHGSVQRSWTAKIGVFVLDLVRENDSWKVNEIQVRR